MLDDIHHGEQLIRNCLLDDSVFSGGDSPIASGTGSIRAKFRMCLLVYLLM
jgi:hypothetical protein